MPEENKKKICLIVIAILIIIITIAAVVGILKSKETTNEGTVPTPKLDSASEEALQNDIDVEIGEFTVTGDESNQKTELNVRVTNKKESVQSFSVQIEAVDSEGNKITDEYVVIENLSAGESKEFIAYENVSRNIIDSLKNATFRLAKVTLF